MSKVEMMLADRPLPEREPDSRATIPRPDPAPLCRWVRQRDVQATRRWKPWWLLGLVVVVTHPRPRWRSRRMVLVPGCRAIPGFPAREPFWVPA